MQRLSRNEQAEQIALLALKKIKHFPQEGFILLGKNDKTSKSDIMHYLPEFRTSVKTIPAIVECRMEKDVAEEDIPNLLYERLFVSNRKQNTYFLPNLLAVVEFHEPNLAHVLIWEKSQISSADLEGHTISRTRSKTIAGEKVYYSSYDLVLDKINVFPKYIQLVDI